MSNGITLSILITCIILQSFFSGSEMILIASNKLKLRRKSQKGSKSAKLALSMTENPRWFLSSTSTGTNISVIVSSIVAAVWFEEFFGVYGEIATIVIMSPILLIIGEIIPRTIFQQRATEFAPKFAYPIWLMSKLISPVTYLVFVISRIFYPSVGKEMSEKSEFMTREELKLFLDIPGNESDLMEKEKELIEKVFHFSKATVSETMIPLVDVKAISCLAGAEEAASVMAETGFSRLPVYKDRVDNLVGIVHAFDLLGINNKKTIMADLVRPVPFIPELAMADELLINLQRSRDSMAIIVDEYGGAVGITTIEDILEEVVGEIRDEYDTQMREMVKLGKKRFLINARMEIDYLNENLELDIPKENYETVGGFLLKGMGKIPRQGEVHIYENLKFTIRLASKRAILEIILDINEPEAESEED